MMTARGNPVSTLWQQIAVTAAIASLFAAGQARANGTNPTVVAGQASFSTQGSSLNISNSPGTIINWQGFSIGADETTRFIQQSAASSVLNRVIGPDPSSILGTLTSNGRVFLVNPSGILVGQGAHIDVAGLVASTLNLNNQDFLEGRLNFSADSLAGTVENQGSITTPSGGSVYLVGANVTNSGIINSPQGDVILAAGQSVKIFDSSTPGVRVEVTASDNSVVNLGKILAQSGEVGIYGAVLRNAGIIDADQVVRDINGKIVLRAKQDVTLDPGSRLTANGEQGGEITVQSETGTTQVSGTIEAKGTGEATGKGGMVQLLGNRVGLIAANVDASGTTGGGTVLVGGDYQGKNPSVQNASATYVSPDSSITADAITSGNGGKVILWADSINRYYGHISARGGVHGGDGGFAEVSGKNNLMFGGYVDLRAPSGRTGMLLLDPLNITIQNAAPDVNGDATTGDDLNSAVNTPNILFADYAGSSSVITTSQVVTQLATADVTLQATNDITVDAAIDASGNATGKALTLEAGHDVIINAALTTSSAGGGSLILSAGNNVTVGAALTAAAGSVSLIADNDGTGPGLAGGTVTFGAVTAGNLTIRFNPVAYTTTASEIAAYEPKATLTGTFDARAWTFIDNASATAQNKAYDGTTIATLNTPFTFLSGPDGASAGQIVTLSAGAANFNSKDVATANTVNFTGYGLSGANASLYSLFSQPANQVANITPKALTQSGLSVAASKIYDATTGTTLIGASALLAAEAPGTGTTADGKAYTGDTVSLTGTSVGTYNSKDVTTASTVTFSGLTLGGAQAGNYSLTDHATQAATITAKTVTLSASKTYTGTTDLTGAVTLTTGISGEALTYTGAFASDAHVATANKYVNAITLADGTGLASNYQLPTLDVTNAPVTISVATLTPTLTNAGVTKTYDGTTDAPTGFSPTYSFIGLVGGDTDATLTSTASAYNDKDVADANKVTVSGLSITAITGGNSSAATDYTLDAASKDVAATITAKTVTLSASKTYTGTTDLTGAVTLATGISGEALTYSGASANDAHVATANKYINAITLADGTGLASNYQLPTLDVTNAPVTISTATLTPTLTNAGVTKTYDGTTDVPAGFSPTYSFTGLVGGDTDATLASTASAYNDKDVADANKVTVSGLSITAITGGNSSAATDYALDAASKDVLATITPAALSITANSTSKTYGSTVSFTGSEFSSIGLMNSETVGSVSLASAGAAAPAGVAGSPYAIMPSAAAGGNFNAGNYTISYVHGTLGVIPVPLMVTADAQSKVYGTSDPVLTFGATGLVNNPALGIADTAATVFSGALTRVSGETVPGGPYAITQGTLAANSNYTLGSFTGNTLAITPAPLNVAANPQSKIFGTSDPALTFSVTGVANNPALGIADTADTVLSGVLTRVPGESALGGPYAITQGSLAANSNYTIGFTPNNLIIIGAAAEPVLGFNAEQVVFVGVINNEFYYRPGNFWHISLNPSNADPGFDVMRGTNDFNARLNRFDSDFGGDFFETWSFPQQFEKVDEE